jgi:hypothetical protein
MTILCILACVLSVSPAVAQRQAEFPNRGVIYGTAVAQDGMPAKGLILNAEPLGAVLGMALPRTKTNDTGAFRFENLPLGRYTVFAEDKKQGYSFFSTGPSGPGHLQEVDLTSEHPEAEFNLRLPPKASFLILHLSNQSTDAAISGVEVTVMSAESPSRMIFSGSFSSTEPVLFPSNKNLLLHVTSWGFHEWDQSVGKGKPIRIAPGDRLTLDVRLEPANPLRARIPDADPKKYEGIQDAKDWRNPYLIVRADGITTASGASGGGSPIPVDSVPAALENLPDSAWPYGLVVAVQDAGVVASKADQSRIEANRILLVRVLNQLGVTVDSWPSA